MERRKLLEMLERIRSGGPIYMPPIARPETALRTFHDSQTGHTWTKPQGARP